MTEGRKVAGIDIRQDEFCTDGRAAEMELTKRKEGNYHLVKLNARERKCFKRRCAFVEAALFWRVL